MSDPKWTPERLRGLADELNDDAHDCLEVRALRAAADEIERLRAIEEAVVTGQICVDIRGGDMADHGWMRHEDHNREIMRLRADNAVVLGLNGTLRAAMREVYETPCYCTPDKCMRCEAIDAAMGGDDEDAG